MKEEIKKRIEAQMDKITEAYKIFDKYSEASSDTMFSSKGIVYIFVDDKFVKNYSEEDLLALNKLGFVRWGEFWLHKDDVLANLIKK